jgi:signal transduction histidine kinase
MAIINAVSSSLKPVLVANAALDSVFSRDPYIREAGIQSALCIPLVRQRSLVGVVYLENHLTECAFSDDQIGLSMFIASQAAMSITNALLVQTLEHKVMERTAELEKSREQADSERLAALKASKAKSALLTNVSHELRTPLNAIIGFSDMLNLMHSGELDPAEEAYLKPRESEYVRDIFESSQHLLKLINEMLDLSKIEAGRIELNFEPVDVDELVQSSLTFVRHHAQDRSTRLHYESDGCCKSFVADSHRIKQVLINLLSNAVKFTAPGGTVLLRVSGVDATLPDGGTAILFEVEDDGRGVAEEDRERIFEPFFRSSNPEIVSIPGTGLGLALSRQLVDRHGGSITVTSGERGGALFRVLLPQPKSWP